MSTPRLGRPSPALAVSIIALLVALGGTSYAALTLPRNSVGTRQLKNGAVTSSKLKNGAVTGAKLNFQGVVVPQADDAATALNAIHAAGADLATNATNASSATKAASATNAGHATNADTATNAGHASSADSATHATSADTAATSTSSTTLGTGQTEVGFFYNVAPESINPSLMGAEISFPHPLAAAPTGEIVQMAGAPTTHCPGSTTSPQAVSGFLCLYVIASTAGSAAIDQLNRFGAGISAPTGGGAGHDSFYGVWATTG